jgi:hypothetical protein
MKRSLLLLSLAFTCGSPPVAAAAPPAPVPSSPLPAQLSPVLAQPSPVLTQPPSPPAAAPSPAYDDPAVHFAPPPGWERVPFAAGSTEASPQPVAFFVKDREEASRRTIVIEIGPYAGTLDDLAEVRASELRAKYDGSFIDRKARVLLSNGMPASWLRVSFGSQAGHMYERYEYIVFDGRRRIVAAYTARRGEGDESGARAALAALSVVLYPRGR